MADKKTPSKAAKPATARKVEQAMPTAAAAPAVKAAVEAPKPAVAKAAEAPKPAVAKAAEAPKPVAAKAAEAPKPPVAAAKPVEAAKPAPVAAKPAPAPAAAKAPEAPKAASAPAPAAAPAAAAPIAAAAPVIEPVAKEATNTSETIVKRTIIMNTETTQVVTDRFQAAFGDMNERARTAMEKGTKLVEELTELTKGNIEAVVASSKVAARGVEQLGQEAAEFNRRSFEQASNTFKSFAEVKSPTEFFKLQSDYARSAFDGIVAETSKMSEAMIKLAGEVAEPISSRYAIAAERVKNAAL